MRKRTFVLVALVLLIAAKTFFETGWKGSKGRQPFVVAAASAVPQSPGTACTLPTQTPDPNDDQAVAKTAWQIFVAVNCPANSSQLVWETWTEQFSIFTSTAGLARPQRLHGSPLARIIAGEENPSALELNPDTECQAMKAPPSNMPKPNTKPKDRKGQFCEEVHLDPTAKAYVLQNNYQLRTGQQQTVTSHGTFGFPSTAVEVKADWLPATDFNPAQFNCTDPPQGLHTEVIDGGCYVLVGMHISSKLLPNWLWATFEAQNTITNPQRCSLKLFGPCNDPFGSKPARSTGQSTEMTPALTALMKQAGLAPEFLNYRLDAGQALYGSTTHPTLLGNSIIEGEAVGLTRGKASCITCHSTSIINAAGLENPNIHGVAGPPPAIPSGYIQRDFAWSLGVACPGAVFNSNPNCPASVGAVQKKQ
jgi:hypothetical protein